MATHDYIISNASGAAVRADLNNALAAIATNNSSATEPTTTYAYQWWADTGSSPTVMKLRNAANSGWITLFQLDGEWTVVPFENGTAAAPSIYFKDSGTDTGVYSPGTDQVGISAGGTSRFEVSTSATTSTLPVVHPLGAVGTPSITFTGDLNTGIWSPAADTVAVSTNGTRAITIDSSQRLGIGTTSPGTRLEVSGADGEFIRINTTTSAGGYMAFRTNTVNMGFIGAGDQLGGGTATDLNVRSQNSLTFCTNGGNERARIDSSGRLLVGTSTSRSTSVSNPKIQIEGTGFGDSSVQLISNDNSDGNASAHLAFGRTRGATPGGTTAVVNNDRLGTISFNGAQNSSLSSIAALIDCYVDGEVQTAGDTTDMPGRLVFSTTADGASSPTERMRVTGTGLIVAASIYNTTTANAANVNTDSNGALARSTSSAKYKTEIEGIDLSYSEQLLNCRPVWYRSLCEKDNSEWSWWGFIAEEVAAIDPRLVQWKTTKVTYDKNGSAVETPCEPEPEGVAYDRFVPHLLNLIKRQKEQIEAMEARLTALESA